MTHLTRDRLEAILARIPELSIGILGDLFLDRYLEIDATLTEPSIETGLDAYQVTRVRSVPGAAGTVLNNLLALGVGFVVPFAVVGDDGEGYELRQALLGSTGRVGIEYLRKEPERRTPTYTKPMLHRPGEPARELNRLDIKNRTPLPAVAEDWLRTSIAEFWESLDGLIVLDQVSEPDCGVLSTRVRDFVPELARREPRKPILADSRERIGLFRDVMIKPNERECLGATGFAHLPDAIAELSRRTGRTVFCTAGKDGIAVVEPGRDLVWVPAIPVSGPLDTVGAGDSTSAALMCALAAGATALEAATLGNLVASITIQQIGTTGTATPDQVRQRHASMTA
jgi:bifunctional ADP-heptose synthase (sugar kinase/adenylyltransferase)